jgi:hypothetical protein
MEKHMSDLNATSETPVEVPAADTPGEQPTGSTVTSNQLPDTPVTPTTPDVTDSAAESVPVAPADTVAGFPVEFSQALHDLFLYIHEAFETISLQVGMARFYEIAKAVKARAEA